MMTPMLNMRYVSSQRQWEFSEYDFGMGRFKLETDMGFAHQGSRQAEGTSTGFKQRVSATARRVEACYQGATWCDWNLINQRNLRAAETILGRPITEKVLEEAARD